MVRGNWQKRVEKAEARKTGAKQRKLKSEEKRLCKVWFQELLEQFDRYDDAIRSHQHNERPPVLHIWTDTVPSLSEHYVDLMEEDERKTKRRADTKGGRPRSDSIPEKGKKKPHPRSNKGAIVTVEEQDKRHLMLCREHFLKGHQSPCHAKGGKKSGCRYIHYSPRFATLAAVLGDALDPELLSVLEQTVIDATPPDLVASDPGAMEFIYYTSVTLPTTAEETLSNFITEKLTENDTPASSIHYAALNGILVFDRLRGGMLLDERAFLAALVNDPKDLDRRASSICSQGSEGGDNSAQLFQNLPSTILEHILLFLPDATVAGAAQVCKAWYNEIGQHSPNLWLQLLKRRKWPVPNQNDVDRGLCRSMFLENYTVLRDLRALAVATSAIVTRQTVSEIEVGYQDFSRRKHAPSHSDKCVSVHGWSDKLILAGYSEDCALRLYEATGFGDTGEMRCKELVYQSVSPYQNTKKRNCQLVAVEIDEHNIGCLCSVSSDIVSGRADILVVLRRDEFLLGSSSDAAPIKKGGVESDDLKVMDIGEAVLNFILSSDVVDHRLLPLFDYLNEGFEIGEIAVHVSDGSLCACGFGRFMVEVSISIPDVLAEDETEMVMLDRKLVLFSSNLNAIVWTGESYPPHLRAHQEVENVEVAVWRQRTACTVVSKSYGSPEIVMTEIDASGNVHPPQFLQASSLARPTIVKENFNFTQCGGLLVTLSEIITLEVMTNEMNGELRDVQSAIVFFPRFPDTHQADFDVMELPKGYLVKRLVSASDAYAVAFCKAVTPGELEDLTGQWFTEDFKTIAVVVNIKSKCIIGEVVFNTDQGLQFGEFGNGSTSGMAIGSSGVAITGDRARATRSRPVLEISVSNTPSPKKKKKALKGKRSGKKDGFARGMSLRG